MAEITRRVLTVIMDGVGANPEHFGNAVALAKTPNLKWLQRHGLYTTIRAHGTAVGLPSDGDVGNSEVGHNTLGAGRIYDQGAKLVNHAIQSREIFSGRVWTEIIERTKGEKHTLHFIGLLSDGNVHSHEEHLFQLLREAHDSGVKKIRIHVLLDGRDVPAKSAEIYLDRLAKVIAALRAKNCDVRVASGGGRMVVTMDRYNADWQMVERGWNTHVLGRGRQFPSIESAIEEFRKDEALTDQYLPEFVIAENGVPVGAMQDGDAVILFNFRGDRAIEISRAFTEENFSEFPRAAIPKVYFAGLMEYDGDLHIPANYLVTPPLIRDTLSERLCSLGARQFACSETQKFGHVTFFWNGNRSGYFDRSRENYVEIPSDNIPFDRKPWMKAFEITEETMKQMRNKSFDFGRINYANGDMVGHTGDLEATIVAVATVDLMLGRLMAAARASDTILVVTADHGNADEMFEGKVADWPDWETADIADRPRGKTAHSLALVPFYIFDPKGKIGVQQLMAPGKGTLANFANTALQLLGADRSQEFHPSLFVES
jgi:2,3-bisphosphoglycerate-independent phosphoglycerate mutase